MTHVHEEVKEKLLGFLDSLFSEYGRSHEQKNNKKSLSQPPPLIR
jgi:hypothetical protein